MPSLAVILLNYRRPQNIGRIVEAAHAALPDAPIFVVDQADDASLRDRTDIDWAHVWLRRPGTNRGAGVRVPLAASLPFDHYLAIDDDVFLTPGQIQALAGRLAADPYRAHGVWGQRLVTTTGGGGKLMTVAWEDGDVSCLNRVYAFTRRQAAQAITLAARVGLGAWDEVRMGDDILLTCASSAPPRCHHLGPIESCPTSDTPGIAVWKESNFGEVRGELFLRLAKLKALTVFAQV